MAEETHSDSRPRPDPTLLTTAQLHREMEWMKGLLTSEIRSVREEIAVRVVANKDAIAKSEYGYEKRFESMNEFRGQMADQASQFITAAESRAMLAAASEKIAALNDRMNRTEGRGSGVGEGKNEVKGNIIGGIGVLVGLASLFMFLSNLSSKVDQNTLHRISPNEEIKAK